jgi:hypothetical protein
MAERKKASRKRRTPTAGAEAAPAGEHEGTPPVEAGAAEQVDPEGHSEFELKNETMETALQTGEHAGLLEDCFGPENYAELRQLSREAAARGVRGGPRVLIKGSTGLQTGEATSWKR